MDKHNVPEHSLKRIKLDGGQGGDEGGKKDEAEAPASAIPHLPEEILDKIFSSLTSASDLHAVSNSTNQFNRILEPSKTKWAFDLVLPHLFSLLEPTDILNCRLVCKPWKQAVDQDLQVRPSCRDLLPYPVKTLSETRPLYAPTFETTLDSKGFQATQLYSVFDLMDRLTKMKDHPENPLVLRSVILDNITDEEVFWELVPVFLERFGSQIWHLCIASSPVVTEPYREFKCTHDMVARFLELTPNLKTLQTCGSFNGNANVALPPLPNLSTLEPLFGENNEARLVPGELINAYSSQLEFVAYYGLGTWQAQQFSNLPQLKTLRLAINARFPSWSLFCQRLVAPKLERIDLIITKNWNVSTLLEPLSEHLQTIKYLSLHFNQKPRDFQEVVRPTFLLENVKSLEVIDSSIVEYGNLFKYLPALEYLVVCRRQRQRKPLVSFQEPNNWHLYHWIRGPSIANSDIWSRLPALKELTLVRLGDNDGNVEIENEIMGRKTFTREVYARLHQEA